MGLNKLINFNNSYNQISWINWVCKIQIKFWTLILSIFYLLPHSATGQQPNAASLSNFGLPGVVDLPSGWRLPDGEIVVMQQLHESLFRTSISFQALPKLGFAFRYTGHGKDGNLAYGRINYDRSFDMHLSIFNETSYLPAISLGLRDFIGTGWYSSEYVVGSKSFGPLKLTAGLGFGRLTGRNKMSNPIGKIFPSFSERNWRSVGHGGTLARANWFRGEASAFYGAYYELGEKLTLSGEYTPDLMLNEKEYMNIKSPWTYGVTYKLNKFFSLKAQRLHGSQASLTAQITANPRRPPLLGGKELAPVPMRLRGTKSASLQQSNQYLIKKVLAADN